MSKCIQCPNDAEDPPLCKPCRDSFPGSPEELDQMITAFKQALTWGWPPQDVNDA